MGWLRKKGVAKFYFDTQKINKEIGLIKINGRIFEKIDDLKFRPRFDYLKFEKCEPIAVLIIKDILFILIKTEHKGQEYFIYIEPITGFCLCDDYSKTIEVATIMAVNQILKFAPGNKVNLIALCQRCHLRLDRPFKFTRKEMGSLIREENQ